MDYASHNALTDMHKTWQKYVTCLRGGGRNGEVVHINASLEMLDAQKSQLFHALVLVLVLIQLHGSNAVDFAACERVLGLREQHDVIFALHSLFSTPHPGTTFPLCWHDADDVTNPFLCWCGVGNSLDVGKHSAAKGNISWQNAPVRFASCMYEKLPLRVFRLSNVAGGAEVWKMARETTKSQQSEAC